MDKKPVFCAFPCAHYAGRTPRRVEWIKACYHAPFRAPTTQGAQRGELESKKPVVMRLSVRPLRRAHTERRIELKK
jgi:hypothetical protein